MKVNPEYNKILAEALVKEDARKESVPMSVIEDIKAEIIKKHLSIIENNDFDNGRTYGYDECLAIIDKHISKSESED